MSEMVFDDPNKFADWCEPFNYFIGSTLSGLSSLPVMPEEEAVASVVTFRLTICIGGSYDAGQYRTNEVYEFRATGVSIWRLLGEPYTENETYIEGFEVDDEASEVDFIIDYRIRLRCKTLEVVKVEEMRVLNKPFLHHRSSTICFDNLSIPIPGQWIEWLDAQGVKSFWSYMYGEPREPETLPQVEYDGWFLRPYPFDENEMGVMFKDLKTFEDGFFCELDDSSCDPSGSEYTPMWKGIASAVSGLSGVSVRSGNCLLSGAEWLRCLDDQQFLAEIDFEYRIEEGIPNGWYPYLPQHFDGNPSRVTTPGGKVSNFGLWPYVRR